MEEQATNTENGGNLRELTADVVSAYVSNNSVPMSELPALISQVHNALNSTEGGASGGAANAPTERPKPAVPIKKSVTDDYIICLEDGKQFKSLKRHLTSKYDMSPEEYRARWNLPPDYPMVAPNYSAARSKLAQEMGLGRKAGGRGKKGGK